MRVAVLGGGRSSEHDVSLASAQSVRSGLAQAGHDVVDVRITREGAWQSGESAVALAPGAGLLEAEVAFPVLHGPYGEDGVIQGVLEALDLPYVGAGVMASAICMDKLVFKDLMAQRSLPQVAYAAITQTGWDSLGPQRVVAGLEQLGLPVFVKPARLGSSMGIAKVGATDDLSAAIVASLCFDPRVIVEACANGVEVECSVLGNSEPLASVPGEIVLTSDDPAAWYDHEAKYTPGGMELRVPARISDSARQRVRELAAATFADCGVSGLARVDFFVDGEDVLVNELNTMPGFTETSVYGELMAASGVPYVELLERLLDLALDRHATERAHSS